VRVALFLMATADLIVAQIVERLRAAAFGAY